MGVSFGRVASVRRYVHNYFQYGLHTSTVITLTHAPIQQPHPRRLRHPVKNPPRSAPATHKAPMMHSLVLNCGVNIVEEYMERTNRRKAYEWGEPEGWDIYKVSPNFCQCCWTEHIYDLKFVTFACIAQSMNAGRLRW